VQRVRTALARLPWVDSATIEANVRTSQVKFSVTTASGYDENQLKESLGRSHFDNVKVLAKSI
jgi:hypothetical protein